MKRFITKKVLAIGLAVGVTLGAGGAAFAYFTSTGAGNGTAATAAAGSIAISTTSISGVAPGAPAVPIGFTLTASAADSFVNNVTASIPMSGNDVTSDGSTAISGCLASWFSLSGDPVSVNQEVNIGHPITIGAVSSGLTLTMTEDNSADQEACAGKSIYVSFTSN